MGTIGQSELYHLIEAANVRGSRVVVATVAHTRGSTPQQRGAKMLFFEDGTAALGYRVAQQVAGRGVATRSVRELCRIAAARHGLRTLRAATSHGNAASRKVLAKAGFVPVGPATPADLGGKSGTWYQRDLQP